MDYFFTANGITDEERKQAIMLTTIGPESYKTLRSLIAPTKPGEKSYRELADKMKPHYSPAPSEIVQRFKFNSRFHNPGESVSTFVSELHSLAEFCNFGGTLDVMLRDRQVCGIRDEHIQHRLLSEENLTFKKALELAQGLETAARNVITLQQSELSSNGATPTVGIHKLETSATLSCYRCGKNNHKADTCHFKDSKCFNC